MADDGTESLPGRSMIDRITTVQLYPSDKLIRRITSTQIMAWDACVSVKATPPGPQIKSNTAETR